jgi:phosphohistidine swiveling domain-containing protein
MSADPAAPNVLNEKPGRPVTWTTVNAGEAAFPGVPTPLSWTWGWWPTEYGVRGAFASIGAFTPGFAEPPTEYADRVLTIHHGHVAINLDLFRAVADAIPTSSGDATERSFFGSVRPGATSRPRRSRYPVVLARMPATALRSRAAIRRLQEPTDRWWRSVVSAPELELAAAQALLVESQRRYAEIAVPHTVVGMVTQGLYDQVRAMCDRAGMPDASGALVPGGQDEGRWLTELWDIAHGRGTPQLFLARHGYHGPLEGELSSPSWRINPRPLQNLLMSYARDSDREPPGELFARRERERIQTQTRFLAALPVTYRAPARGLLAAARAYMPLRESGRATFLRAYDAARQGALAIGRHYVGQRLLDTEDDVFYLSFDELTAPKPPADARERVTVRCELRQHYRTVALPSLWTGDPTSRLTRLDDTPAVSDEPLSGLGVSAGVAEGIARVVLDPADSDDLDAGEILVCRATDPSWASLFYLAGAVVVDIGGEMSHGAIVARELGLPAVVNTRDGTRRLQTGDRIRVDGSLGTVTLLHTAAR